jgi:hypothetical protein
MSLENELIGDHEMIGDELVGDEDVGDDDVADAELIGALRRAGKHKAAAAVAAGRTKGMRSPRNFLWRRQALGVNGTAVIAPTASTTITSFPQSDFKAKRLIVSSDIAFDFDITETKVGQQSQLVSAGAMPASAFSEVAVSAYVDWDTANLGNQISLIVTNVGAVNRSWRAAIIGLVAHAQY